MLALPCPLACLAAAACTTIACVAPGTGETGPPSGIIAASGCEGLAPPCVMSCDARAYLERASCEGGVWHCDAGVRIDLCCDPVNAPENCPEWGDECDACADDTCSGPCADGYTCVTSRNWPLPAETGVCRLGDWSIPEPLGDCAREDLLRPELLLGLGTAAVKLEGVVAAEMDCNGKRCGAQNPCCQRCVGSYVLDLDGEEQLRIALRTETIACIGTNCGFSCAPLQPGRRYLVWGLWVPDDAGAAPGELFVAGSCAD